MVTISPSRDLTVRSWPSSFSTAPRMRLGVPCGACWAPAGKIRSAINAPASSNVVFIAVPPLVQSLSAVAIPNTNRAPRAWWPVSLFGDPPVLGTLGDLGVAAKGRRLGHLGCPELRWIDGLSCSGRRICRADPDTALSCPPSRAADRFQLGAGRASNSGTDRGFAGARHNRWEQSGARRDADHRRAGCAGPGAE